MGFLKKLDKILTFIEDHLIAILLIIMTAITFWGVIARFVLRDSSSWAEEAARYLSIWAAFIGASLGVKKGAHIGVEAFVMILPKKVQQYISIITTVFCIIFCCAVSYIGYDYTLKLLKTGQLSPAMRMPIVWAYAAVPVGCLLMTIRYFMLLIEQIFTLKAVEDTESDKNQVIADNAIAGGETING
ncbi:TRAP transporter small permease subunit [Thermanaerosceptrum fracticalcis]|uniref:TRAP transporter small permease subunit n=1 Tax=Thermanaerosceptrum fracticalcis TaxID=1712410 RepID=A0A7G6E3F6_THEFR|nr:TRAP transporter small permease [Thermanaerosceptrum fracticalcis]QNB46610.1 TRAP transporter small permease subunit [Thermanaerosceptrum fracticalcis]